MLYPDARRLGTALESAQGLRRLGERLPHLTFSHHWGQLVSALEQAFAGPDLVQGDYARLFLSGWPEAQCPPYESVHLGQDRQGAVWTMAELDRAYAAAGLKLASSLGEMPDHAAVELEFMSFLCRQEANAWERREAASGLSALESEAVFLTEHLCCWFPAFARQVAQHNSGGIYSAIVESARTFLVEDRDVAAALISELPAVLGAPVTVGVAHA